MQGTRVWALVREDLTCHGATKPVCHNYRACELQLLSPCATTTEACTPRARVPNKRSHRSEKPVHHNEEEPPLTATRESPRAATKTNAAKNKFKKKKKVEDRTLSLKGFQIHPKFPEIVQTRVAHNIILVSVSSEATPAFSLCIELNKAIHL